MTVEPGYVGQAQRVGGGSPGEGLDGFGEGTLPEAPEPAPSGATVSQSERYQLHQGKGRRYLPARGNPQSLNTDTRKCFEILLLHK